MTALLLSRVALSPAISIRLPRTARILILLLREAGQLMYRPPQAIKSQPWPIEAAYYVWGTVWRLWAIASALVMLALILGGLHLCR